MSKRPKGRQLRRNVTGEDLPNDNGEPPDWEITDELGFVEQGAGYILMGLGADETPRARPPTAELRKAAESKHNYSDLRQPPVREEFVHDAAFNEALLGWLVNVAPTVVRRNKRGERLELKPGATAKEIADAIREKAKGETA